MEITVKDAKGRGKRKARKVAIDGAMTIYAAAAAKDTLLGTLEGAADLQVDLSGVAEMDTAGAQLLVLLKREGASAGKHVSLSAHSPAVREVFDRYRLDALFGDGGDYRKGKR